MSEADENGWITIDTAPLDGTDIILGFARHKRPPVIAGWFGDGAWVEYDSCNNIKGKPTHWQPVPKPPVQP